MAPNVLLAAKLVVLALLFSRGWTHWREVLGTPVPWALIGWTFLLSALALQFNRAVRVAAPLAGIAGVLVLLVSGSDLLFCALFLVLTGSQKREREPVLLRYSVVLLYLSAFVPGSIATIETMAPWLAGSEPFGWATPLAAGALSAGFLFRRTWRYAIWLGVLAHAGAMLFYGGVTPLFYLAAPASYLVFAPWPKEKLTVLYDGDCGFCETTRRFFERIDFDGIYDWQPFQGGTGDRWGIPSTALERAAHVVVDGKVYAGFRAFHAITLYNPLTYFVLALLLLLTGAISPAAQAAVAASAIALYFPLFWPMGEAIYQLIARNRHRLPGEKSCKVA